MGLNNSCSVANVLRVFDYSNTTDGVNSYDKYSIKYSGYCLPIDNGFRSIPKYLQISFSDPREHYVSGTARA